MTPPDPEGTRIPQFEAILRSVDREQPMNGEKAVASASLEEARRWTSVYREVVSMEQAVLSSISRQLPTLSASARAEAESTNVPLIQGQLTRFQHRLMLWEARLAEFDGEGG